MADAAAEDGRTASALARLRALWPGLALVAVVAMAAAFLAEHHGGSPFLYALLVGMALASVNDSPALAPGLALAGRSVLRWGVALLGLTIGLDSIAALGAPVLALVAGLVAATILAGIALSRLLGRSVGLGVLTGGATAICGASAALAIAASLPASPARERELAGTVVCVTLLSSLAMAVYPAGMALAGWGPETAGVFLGATIHDVAQVVGAGYSVSEDAGETAVLTKLFRVALLVPVVLAITLATRTVAPSGGGARLVGLLPGFLVAFVLLAGLSSLGLVPTTLAETAGTLSRACLLAAVAAAGIRTPLRSLGSVGWRLPALVLAETLLLASLAGLALGSLGSPALG